MSKDKISDYSATANSNTDIGGINIDEGCAPSGINDAIRTLMKQLKDWQSGSQDVYIHPAGSASVPSITATGDTNTGLFFPAADTVGITTGGTERARVDSSGNLGLGVTPSAWSGNWNKGIEFTNSSYIVPFAGATYSNLILGNNAYYNGTNWIYKASNYASRYQINDNGSHQWFNAASGTAGNTISFTQAMTLDASGNLAVQNTNSGGWLYSGVSAGSGSSDAAFTTYSGSSNYGAIAFADSTSGTARYSGLIQYFHSNDSMQFYTASTERARIDSSGNFGIGTTSPTSITGTARVLDVVGSSYGFGLFGNGTVTAQVVGDGANSVGIVGTRTNHALTLTTNNTERARIDSSGNLYLGTTSNLLGGIFQLYRSNADGMTSKTDTAINNVPYFAWNAHTSGDNQFHRFYTEASYTQRGSIDYNRASNVTRYNTTSDATLKNIIGDAEANKSVEILSSTRIREYSWKSDESDKPQIGVIAQELYETFKGAVSVGGNMDKTDADGNITTEYVPWSVDKTAFTFHLVKGWQEHQRIIQEQQQIITQLQADVAALKGQA